MCQQETTNKNISKTNKNAKKEHLLYGAPLAVNMEGGKKSKIIKYKIKTNEKQ
jgi:hypothetical protein